MSSPHIVLLDNHDSFVYNLVDALAGFDTTVFRNTVAVHDVLRAQPDIIVLSPGPGHPRDAGCMMELIDATLGTTPILGVCLGFQPRRFGRTVRPRAREVHPDDPDRGRRYAPRLSGPCHRY